MTGTTTITIQPPRLMNSLSPTRSRQSRQSSISNSPDTIPSNTSQEPPLRPTESHSSSSDSESLQGTSPPPAPVSSSSTRNSRNRRSLAAIAREKTFSAFASFASITTSPSPSVHESSSSVSLARPKKALSVRSTAPSGRTAHDQQPTRIDIAEPPLLPQTPPEVDSPPAPAYKASSSPNSSPRAFHSANSSVDRFSSPPPDYSPKGSYNKMHQTSSRLLRMTDEERPFTRVGQVVPFLPYNPLRVKIFTPCQF